MTDPKRIADRMRASAQVVEVLAPFDEGDRLQIVIGVILMLDLLPKGGRDKAINDLLTRVQQAVKQGG